MPLYLITAPATTPITTAEAKTHLRVDHSDDDTFIAALVSAATAHLDGRDGWLGRALVTQTWELRLDDFDEDDNGEIRLPLPPLQSITHVKYYDTNGTLQTLSSSTVYQTLGVGSAMPGYICRRYGQTWPDVQSGLREAVQIQFVAGYGAASAVPETIKAALKLTVGNLYANRENVVVGVSAIELPKGAEFLLSNFQVPYVA